jgi:aspartyl-tRNA(Asn)/glutamyl-tRNA(Gln) amidotransferase subunit A
VTVLESCGATVEEVVLPHYAESATATLVTMISEALAYHRQDLRSRGEEYFTATRTLLELGESFTGADYVQAQRVRRLAQRVLARVFERVDVIAMPTVADVAPTYERVLTGGAPGIVSAVMSEHHTAYWNAVGNPVLAVPMGVNADGLPLSMQLAARPFEEALLVRVGDAYQQATDWHLRMPPIVAGTGESTGGPAVVSPTRRGDTP